MADNLRKAPKKGILKSSSSFEKTEPYRCINQKEMKWDEMNILQTLHPPDKDYGHMKIDEPKTPYSHFKEPGEEGPTENADPHSDSDDERDGIDPKQLAMQIKLGSSQLPKAMIVDDDDDDDDEEDEYANETEEQRAKRKLFEKRRREHYNEFFAVKLARKLREEEEEEDEDEDENAKGDSLTSDSHVSDEQNHDHMDHQAVSTSLSSESPNSRDTAHLDGD